MTKKTWVGVVVGLVLAFAAGWLVAQVQNVNKLSRDKVAATKWEHSIALLVTNAHNTAMIDPAKAYMMIGADLDGQSVVLAYLYDGMSPVLKKQLALWIPAARVIAHEQQGQGVLHDRTYLLIFANCMQKVQAEGGSLRKCVESHREWKAGRVKGGAGSG